MGTLDRSHGSVLFDDPTDVLARSRALVQEHALPLLTRSPSRLKSTGRLEGRSKSTQWTPGRPR